MKKFILFTIIFFNFIFLNGQNLYYIQIGAFEKMQNIDNFIEDYKNHQLIIDFNDNYYKIRIGYFENYEDASFYMLNENIIGFIGYKNDYFIKFEKSENELLIIILNQLINMNDKLNKLSINTNEPEKEIKKDNDINQLINESEIKKDDTNESEKEIKKDNDINELINESEIKKNDNDRFNNTISLGVSILELHDDKFLNYNGLILGFNNSYLLNNNIYLNLSINYGYYQANALNHNYNINGHSNILAISPSISYNKNFFYGIGLSYFNYKYSYEAFLKPDAIGVTNINKELLQRNGDVGINIFVGLNLFKNISVNFTNYFDNNNRRLHSLQIEYKI